MKRATRQIIRRERARRAEPRAKWDWRSSPWARVFLGALFVLLALLASWRVEQTSFRYHAALRSLVGPTAGVQDLGRLARPSGRLNGAWVRVVGVPKVIVAPRDPVFNQSADTLLLRREVAMFQWQQVDVGYPVYELEWHAGRVDSSTFLRPKGHQNPLLPVQPAVFVAQRVELDGFVLDPFLVERIPGREALPVADALPPNLAATFGVHDGDLYSGDPMHPRLGDVRLRWRAVPTQAVTVLAPVDGDRLVASRGASVQLGDRSLGDLLPQLPPRPIDAWLSRLVATLLAIGGVALISAARVKRVDGVLVVSCGIALMLVSPVLTWSSYSLLFGGVLGLMLIGCLGTALWRWHRLRPVTE